MKILTRYMIRAHLGPFFFAFAAVTGLLFLNAVAQRLENFAGKGLEWSVIGEFMILSLPHIVALTFPMAILVAVLYTFSDMTSQNEVTAVAAGGVHPLRLLVPLVGAGLFLSVAMYVFNDRVLPESNHRLSSLLSDVGSKSPTFELREDVVNEVHTGDDSRYFLRARGIDAATNEMTDVEIFDLSQVGESRTIVAKRGEMAFTPDRSDLFLTLHDGVVYETTRDRPGAFQRMEFSTQILPFKGVGTQLQRRDGEGRRGEREMSIAMLQQRVDENVESLTSIANESRRVSIETVQEALGGPQATDAEELLDEADLEAELEEELGEELGEEVAEELGRELREEAGEDPQEGVSGDDALAQEEVGEPEEEEEDEFLAVREMLLVDTALDNVNSVFRINTTRWTIHRNASYRYRVEIHKKYAIAFACLVFILLGAPMAMRFPQGGAGMAIAASVTIFFFYWMGLIGGERFADRGQMNPVLAMWLPNALLLLAAVYLLRNMAGQMSTNRGSPKDELKAWLGRRLGALFGRRGAEPASEGSA